MLETIEQKQIADILEQEPIKIIISNLADTNYPYKKIVIQKLMLKEKINFQIQKFTEKQVFHENIKKSNLADFIFSVFSIHFLQLNIFSETEQWDFKITKKGKLLKKKQSLSLLKKAKQSDNKKQITHDALSHNRKKHYLLEEGTVIPPLVDLGIFTKDGKIVRTMYDKYKQINRFLELVDDVIKDEPYKKLNIIDFGCGKSYLTFILYYYLVEIKGYQIQMTGLDLKEEVIQKCNATAQKYHYDHLSFQLGDINGYHTDETIDMVVTLHACDTATDYALFNAISWNAKIILSVPCCQHELNQQIHTDELSAFTRYGIVKERICALMTDTIRANLLEYFGYKTQLLEFIDISHSPKNILIRARKGNRSHVQKEKALVEVRNLIETFHINPTLYQLLFPNQDI